MYKKVFQKICLSLFFTTVTKKNFESNNIFLRFYFSTPSQIFFSPTAPTYRIPSNSTNRRFFVSTSKRFKLLNQLPSDALLLLLCKSGGWRKRFGYGAALVALTFAFDDVKHPVPTQPERTDEVAPLLKLFERDAFSFNDLAFPLVDVT